MLITAREDASAAGRYWTYRGDQWDALASRLDREGLSLGAILTAAHLHVRDRGQDGSVHLDS
jgi:hypothetical protein